MSDLATKATRGMFWSLAENFGLQAVQLVISILLARLLTPEQFGLIGMLTLFMALAQSLLDSGFGSALIQKKEVTQVDLCSVFYFNLLVGVLLTALLWAAAPLISRFFDEPMLTPLTRVLALNLVINAFALAPSALLTRRMDFKALLKVSFLAAGLSGGVAIGLALQGFGVWSLAVQAVLASLLRAALLWLASRWRPSLLFSRASLAAMFSFGSRMLLSGLLDTFFTNIYQPLIGRLYSAADVGYYVRAQTLRDSAIQPTGSALGRVLFPTLSPLQQDRARMRHAVQKVLTTAAFVHFPLMIGLMAVADALLRLLLTDRWASSIPYFQLFCVIGLLYPLHVINLTVLTSTGRSDLFLRLELIKKASVLLAIAVTYRWGITALLYGQIATSLLAYGLNSYYSGALIGYPTRRQLHDIAPFLAMALLMGGAMAGVGAAIAPLLPRLLAQTATGLLVYFALSWLLSRTMLSDLLTLARQAMHAPAAA